ncbi:DUF21 domain-containing protein [Leptolyngbya sp. FACHB-261]|nr:DUF21 domain-containing protein [Leptolyngbya sp. FACHB-261]
MLRLAGLFLLTLVIAFFVAAELALVSASRQQIARLAENQGQANEAAQRVQYAQNHLERYLSVTQTGTTAGSLLLGWLGEDATVHWIEPWTSHLPLGPVGSMVSTHTIAVALAFLLVTYVEISLGELVPKVLAANAPERTALLLIRPLQICAYLFWPLLVVLDGTVSLLTGWLKRRQNALPELTPAQAPVLQADPHSVMVSGVLELTMLNETLGLTLPSNPAYRTLAGFMIHELGRVPQQGERLVWGELELEAARVADNRLDAVLLRQVTRPLAMPEVELVG